VEVVVGAVGDRGDPADVGRVAARHEQLDLGVAEERVLVGEDLREVRANWRDPVRVVAVEPLGDVEEAAEVALSATDALDRGGQGLFVRRRRGAAARARARPCRSPRARA
jgi:hypothetical protein